MILSSIYNNHMILQRGVANKICGIAKPNEKVCAYLNEESFTAVANQDGAFELVLSEQAAGGPFTLRICSDSDEKVFDDILFGDVFLLGGQSNMELPVAYTLDYEREQVKKASCDMIRMFQMPKEADFSGKSRALEDGEWISVTPESVLDFSAIGYYFALEKLAEDKIPVGLVHAAVGGAPIETFMSKENLLATANKIRATKNPQFACDNNKNMGCLMCYEQMLEKDEQALYMEKVKMTDQSRIEAWHKQLDQYDPGIDEGWMKKKWNTVDFTYEMPGFFEDERLKDYFGSVWLQKTIDLPEEFTESEVILSLGTLVDGDETYLNGELVGKTDFRYPPRRYELKPGTLKAGENVITIRLSIDNSVAGAVPDMPYAIKMGEKEFSLEGTWNVRMGTKSSRLEGETFFIWHPTALYHTMISPLAGMSFKAVLFYQGESNCGHPEYYEELFQAMVSEWRSMFGQIPFLVGEITYYLGDGPVYCNDPFDGIRAVQNDMIDRVEDAYLVKYYDLGQYNELHPQNKKQVAQRFYEIYKEKIES